jgi:hypothetical protein
MEGIGLEQATLIADKVIDLEDLRDIIGRVAGVDVQCFRDLKYPQLLGVQVPVGITVQVEDEGKHEGISHEAMIVLAHAHVVARQPDWLTMLARVSPNSPSR